MKDATRERVERDMEGWAYLAELPEELHGFRLERRMEACGDVYELYRYVDPKRHRSIAAYFHEETKEYKVRVGIGLIEFCRMEFITGSIESFDRLLREQFDALARWMSEFHAEKLGSILRATHILEWAYGSRLPESLEGFELFICPAEPVEITNGSYVIIDYSDFGLESSLSIYYNMFRDEFFGEARIRRIPDVSYLFDSKTLEELEARLEEHLSSRLREIRQRAEAAQANGKEPEAN